jgi:Protein of unknown function (DUF1573)
MATIVVFLQYYFIKLQKISNMKKLLMLIALFASVATLSVAQNATAPVKKAKTSKHAKKAMAQASNTTVTLPSTTAVAAKAATPAPAAGAVATFEKTEIDYGKIKQGSEPLRVFAFKNTGSEPLTISNAQGSCGCTVPTYPKEPIMPGQTSKIEVRYDTQRLGGFTKTVTLTTNEANPTRVLTIKGEVETPAPATPATTDAPKN